MHDIAGIGSAPRDKQQAGRDAMKHIWPEHELTDHFTLSNDDLHLLSNKPAPSRIGCAVLLKYFQHEGRFPVATKDVPKQIIRHLAAQLDAPAEAYSEYNRYT